MSLCRRANEGKQLRRVSHRRGPRKAIGAVAASIPSAVYHMLKDGTCHRGLGADHFQTTSSGARAKEFARQYRKVRLLRLPPIGALLDHVQ